MSDRLTFVQQAVLAEFKMDKEQLLGTSRSQGYVRARHVAFYLERELIGRSFPDIGRLYSRDHSSVLAGYNHIKERIAVGADDILIAQVSSLKRAVVAQSEEQNDVAKLACPTCGAPVIAELRRQIEELKTKMEALNARTAT